ncbi:CDP-glycerol glycerophosphotransferase family protein [Oceanobacillus picturae]|uniref:CDP-glycerol glycerophosphotransferase family protein n=1 Tax=Oceanobacillus picturae TaxID=171693 RepID=UPI000E694073|nr:CDP-glycerol glycerophosphotransferase family protein [Oceanobacillus picturae]RIU94909.1 polyribitolphosphotransferase [Oceanobacillus picturae]
MFISSIDNKNLEIKTEANVISGITTFSLNGSYLKLNGYAYIDNIPSFDEGRIRKSLILLPKLDYEKIRNKNVDLWEQTDEDIMDSFLIECALDNCHHTEITEDDIEISEDSLSGFRGIIDLSTISNGKPLESGEYDALLKFEQMPSDSDDYKFEKIIPLQNMKGIMKSSLLTTKLEYFSSVKVLRYNLMVSFDLRSKTMKFKNTLLQSYDPRDLPSNLEAKEGKKIAAIKRRIFKLFYMLFNIFPIDRKKVIFASDSRTELNGNFYFVYEELYKRGLDLNINFVFNERINNKKTIYDLVKIAYQFATAKVILLDDFYPMVYPLRIRNKADLIQVWHAAGAFKTFGYSRIGRPGGPSPRSKNHKNYTKVVVSSEGVRKNYAEGFGIDTDKVYSTGTPRADIFFDESYKSHVRNALYDRYPFLSGKKVILFAPTFRGNGQASAHYPFEMLNLKELYDELNEEYVFLFKIHPFVKNKLTIPYEYANFFYDLSDYREINDLLLITDILITDYSSVCFEFALLNKPMLFYAFDVEKYIEDRDFYYNFADFIPGPLIKSTRELTETIKEEKFDVDKIKAFVEYFFDNNLGNASKNVVDDLIIPSLEDQDRNKVTKSDKNEIKPPASRIELFEKSIQEQDD